MVDVARQGRQGPVSGSARTARPGRPAGSDPGGASERASAAWAASQPPARPRIGGRPRSAAAHQAILDAARELLIEEGFTRLRLEHVAARAGVGKSTIYRRWRSKEALTLELLLDLAGPHLEIRDVGDTRAELVAAVRNPLRAITTTPFGPVIRAMMSQIAGNPAIGDAFRSTVVAQRRAEIARVIERGVARGDLRPDADSSVATELLAGPVYFRLVFGGALDEDLVTRVVETVLNGLAAR